MSTIFTITVAGAETCLAMARLGFGLIQVPRYHVEEDLAAGRLVEVLPQCPPTPSPVSVLYPSTPQLSPRVRVIIDWLVREFAAPAMPRAGRPQGPVPSPR